jgi:hypothetical protein
MKLVKVLCPIGRLIRFKKEGLLAKKDPGEDPEILKEQITLEKFRLTGKKLFLIYSKTTLKKEEALSQLRLILKDGIKDYLIGEKNNQDDSSDLYVYLSLDYKINVVSKSKFHLKLANGEIQYGQYNTVKNKNAVIDYIQKSDSFITTAKKNNVFYIELYEISKRKGIEEAMKFFELYRPEWVCSKYKNIKSNLKAYLKNNSFCA